MKDGEPISCFAYQNGVLAFSTSSYQLFTFSIADRQDSTPKYEARSHGRVHVSPAAQMTIDPTSTVVALGSSDRSVRVYQISPFYPTHVFSARRGHRGVISALRFFNFGDTWYLASGDHSGGIFIRNLSTKESMAIPGHASAVTGLDYCAPFLYSCGRDKVVQIFSVKSKQKVLTLPIFDELEGIQVVTESKDGLKPEEIEYLVTGKRGETRRYRHGELLTTIADLGVASSHLAYNATTNTFASAHIDGTISLYQDNVRVKRFVGMMDHVLSSAYIPRGVEGHEADVKMTQDDSNSFTGYLVVATNSPNVYVFDLQTMDSSIMSGHEDTVMSVAAHKRGHVVTGSKDGTARIWKDFGASSTVLKGHQGPVTAVAVSVNGDRFLTGSEDMCIKLWNLATGKSVFTVKAHVKTINTLAFAPRKSEIFASGSQDKTIQLWKTSDGSNIGTLRSHRRGVWCVAFSPNEEFLAAASGDETISIWSVSQRSCLAQLSGHSSSVLQLSFITNGTQLVSTGTDGLLKVWDVNEGKCVLTEDAHDAKVWSLSVVDDGRIIISGAEDSTVNIWIDKTREFTKKTEQETQLKVQNEQELQNAMREADMRKAFKLALTMGKPYHLLQILTRYEDDKDIRDLVASCEPEQHQALLKHVVDWSSTNKHSYTAHRLLSVLLDIVDLDDVKLQDSIKALVVYSERHLRRLEETLVKTHISDFMVKQTSGLLGEPGR